MKRSKQNTCKPLMAPDDWEVGMFVTVMYPTNKDQIMRQGESHVLVKCEDSSGTRNVYQVLAVNYPKVLLVPVIDYSAFVGSVPKACVFHIPEYKWGKISQEFVDAYHNHLDKNK